MTRRRRPGFTRGLAVAGRQLLAASFGRKSYGAAAAAHGTPVTGRCGPRRIPLPRSASTTTRPTRSRQVRRSPGEMSQPPGRNAAHCPGWPLQPQRVLRIPLRGTRLRRAVDPGDLCQLQRA